MVCWILNFNVISGKNSSAKFLLHVYSEKSVVEIVRETVLMKWWNGDEGLGVEGRTFTYNHPYIAALENACPKKVSNWSNSRN